MTITHKKQVALPENPPAGGIGPTEWNDDHNVTLSSTDLPLITVTGSVQGSGSEGLITVSLGGTTSYTDGQILIGDSSTGELDVATLTAGNNVTITNGHGSILISASASGGSGFTSAGTGLTAGGTTTVSLLTPVAVNLGGTGQASYTDGQLLIGNTSGNTLAKGTLSAGNNVSITNGHGTILISATDTTGFTSAGTGLTSSGGTTVSLLVPVAINLGGTGQTASPTDGQLLIGDSNAGAFDLHTLSAGNNVSITNGHGTILISASSGGSGFTSAGTGLTSSGGTTVSLLVPVAISLGGTGQIASPTDGQLLIGDSNTNGFDLATLSAGNNVTITNGHGSILISASGSGGPVPALQLITAASLTGVTLITVSSVTNSFTDLVLVVRGRTTTASANEPVTPRLNVDNGAHWDGNRLLWQGTQITSIDFSNAQATSLPTQLPGAGATASFAGSITYTIFNYASTAFFHAVEYTNNFVTASGHISLAGELIWKSASAVSTVEVLIPSGASFATGSTLSLYGRL